MASKNDQATAVTSELERLRDILFGEYARQTGTKLDALEERMAQFRREVLKSLGDQGSEQANQVEATRQAMEDRLDTLGEELRGEINRLREEMTGHVARLENALTERRVLGRLLIDLGHQLQSGEPGEDEG